MNELVVWATFFASATAVVLAGIRLSRDGDTIAEHTGLGGAWVGAILLAGTTSLPELTTNVYSVGLGNVNLAAGDLFGSNMVNMLLLALADLATRNTRILAQVAFSQILVGLLALVLMTVAAIGVLVRSEVTILWLGWGTAAIALAYLAGVRLLHESRAAAVAADAGAAHPRPADRTALRRALIGFALAASVVFVAASFLASSAARIAELLGVSSGFVGLAMLAIVTSLPEAVVSVASLRSGSYDLAVGNLLGSNTFNMAISVVLDVVDGPGAILARIDPAMLVAAGFAMLLTTLALFEIANRATRPIRRIEPIPTVMVLAYAVGLYLTYQIGQ